ncbi:precorrin-3B synthase [Haloechinothrix sp. YIM 98757]|uniref:Precorrin-3B synthase n=1 Tax=Haloechinothrix aidingensis TaxID=2752311 RepID=A0A838AE03_9PSEU|nr:precorrin-3B synthase [Haloechinothrix aidingensis]MBA0127358.1 precorrin-3B synthase [Haloechinothrix aidingensis]
MSDPHQATPAGYRRGARADACPGALTTHEAADGQLARVRVPGGRLRAGQLRELAACAEEFGDGVLHLTSRGNVQLRGLGADAGLADRIAAAGLLPSASHERVRNIVASPLSGLSGGVADVRPLAGELDEAVCARPELASLPGRFLFGLDDGRADVADDRIDACWYALDAGTGALVLAGRDTGLRVPAGRAADALVEAAATFGRVRGDAWQVRELDDRADRIADAVAAQLGSGVGRARQTPRALPRSAEPPLGATRQDDGGWLVVAGITFGAISGAQARTLAGLAGTVTLTPWRSVVVGDIDADAVDTVIAGLDAAGFLLSEGAPEHAVGACIGSPGCAKSRADVRADVSEVMRTAGGALAGAATAAHFSGCERRCGRPRAEHVDVLAEGDGYRVDGNWVPVERLAEALACATNAGGEAAADHGHTARPGRTQQERTGS